MTTLDHISKLPQPYGEQVLANIRRQRIYCLTSPCKDAASCIDSFDWSKSEEGYLYWASAYSGVRGNCDRDMIEQQVRDVVVTQLNVDGSHVMLDSSFYDLGADSLDDVELLMALEDEFGYDIPESEAEKLKTVRDVVNYVCAQRVRAS